MLLEDLIPMLLNHNKVENAVFVLQNLQEIGGADSYVNKFISAFAVKGVLNRLLFLVPDPNDPNALKAEVYN